MMPTREDWEAVLQRIRDEEPEQPMPTVEEIDACYAGTLPAARAEAVRDFLVAHPEVALAWLREP